MDVFIPEDYVMRRRKEKRAAAAAGKRVRQEESRGRGAEEKKTHPSNESFVANGLSECAIFSWFSA